MGYIGLAPPSFSFKMATKIAPPAPPSASEAVAKKFWEDLTDVAGAMQGSRVVFATDDWFAAAEGMLAPEEPSFVADRFTEWGKWMDGWETRRKRVAGHDWCIIELSSRSRVFGFEFDTAFFTGNQVPAVSIQSFDVSTDESVKQAIAVLQNMRRDPLNDGAQMGGFAATSEQVAAAHALLSQDWDEILPRQALCPGYEETRRHKFDAQVPGGLHGARTVCVATHLRVNLFPDGGIARLRVRGEIIRSQRELHRLLDVSEGNVIDVAAAANGGAVLGASNAHYGRASNLLNSGRSQRMDQGWETARNPKRPAILLVREQDGMLDLPAHMGDWVVVRLCCESIVSRIEIDTDHFKGNCPEYVTLDFTRFDSSRVPRSDELAACLRKASAWKSLLPGRTRIKPHSRHNFAVPNAVPATHVRLRIFPDGGIARLRIFGIPAYQRSVL